VRHHIKYADYLLKHRWYVFVECLKVGLLWRGLIHDWTKFLPGEWKAYAEFFYLEQTPERKAAFSTAWTRHINFHDHHWQAWVSLSDSGKLVAREMPDKARKEMICDWVGAHKATGGHDLAGWYRARETGILLAPKTKRWVRHQLGMK
jgi:hypothetical protein